MKNIVELQKKLFAAARAVLPSEGVPYAFEKRVMARILAEPIIDVWALWSRLLWRAAAPCVAIMLVTTVWAVFSSDLNGSFDTLAAEDLENTILAPLPHLEDTL
jgi:hypothetical protein